MTHYPTERDQSFERKGIMETIQFGQNLLTLVGMADELNQVYKASLQSGDYLAVQTCNSHYSIRVVGCGWFEISGGWFDRKGKSPMRVRINGCTWGGTAIKINIAAACGLCLEFSNRVVTSSIQKIFVFHNSNLN